MASSNRRKCGPRSATSDVGGSGSGGPGGSGSSLDRSSSMAFAFFSRRHSSTAGLRRSVSSVSSRRHSSPISSAAEKAENGGGSLSDGDAELPTSGSPGSRSGFPRSLRWRLLARKVLGNVDESEESRDSGANAGKIIIFSLFIDMKNLFDLHIAFRSDQFKHRSRQSALAIIE